MSRPLKKHRTLTDEAWLMREASRITAALGETLQPLCEVVLHDLTDPEHAIVQIENNLSGRAVGDAATEMGLSRILDPNFPEVIANYANTFPDGRPAKSTSIGLKDKSGRYFAAICLNIDISYLRSIGGYIKQLTDIKPSAVPVTEHLSHRTTDLVAKVLAFAAAKNRDPRALSSDERAQMLRLLASQGELERRGAAQQIAGMLGISRSNVYYYLKNSKSETAPPTLKRQPKRPSSLARKRHAAR